MSEKLRIMMYTPTVPMEAGGVQGVFRTLAKSLIERGHDARMIWPVPNYAAKRGDPEDYFPWLEARLGLLSPKAWRHRLLRLKRMGLGLTRHRPDVVNIHFVGAGGHFFRRLRPAFGYQLVLSFHGSDALQMTEAEAARLRKLVRQADAITAVSPPVAAAVANRFGLPIDDIHVIANGVDHAFWSALPRKEPAGPPTLLCVGRLTPVKGQDILLDAFAEVRRHVPDCRLILVGDGETAEPLRRQIESLGLSEAVTLMGQRNAGEVRELFSRATALVMPSRSEGMPLVLLEAMTAGLPCVATAVGGVPGMLDGGAGLLCPPADARCLASEIVDLLGDPERRVAMAAAAARRASRHTTRRTAECYETLFRDLLGEPTRPAVSAGGRLSRT